MINFKEKSSAQDIIHELEEYIPCLDEDRKFIIKYRKDFIYHYNHNFFNLALFSFHYLYMFIINISMVKYYGFDVNIIRNQTGNRCNSGLEPFFYFGRQPEKKVINKGIVSDEIRRIHISNVEMRDSIAHSSGIIISNKKIIEYIKNCFTVLEMLQPKVLSNCYDKKYENWEDINNNLLNAIWNKDLDEMESIIINFLIDYYLSYKDISYLDTITKTLNAVKFLRQFIILEEGNYSLAYNEEFDLHKSFYDNFKSNFEPAVTSQNSNILTKEEIMTILIKMDTSYHKYIAYNVLNRILDESEYWVPSGSQKIKKKSINI